MKRRSFLKVLAALPFIGVAVHKIVPRRFIYPPEFVEHDRPVIDLAEIENKKFDLIERTSSLDELLSSPEGRKKVAQAMSAPVRDRLAWERVLRRFSPPRQL